MKLLLPSGEGWDDGENIKCSVRCAHDSKANCGSPHRGRVSFFARAKKETKESTPRMARKPHCGSRRNRRSPNSPGACTRGAPIRGAPVRRHGSPPDFHEYSASPSGSNTVSLDYSRWDCGTWRALRSLKKNFSTLNLTQGSRSTNMGRR